MTAYVTSSPDLASTATRCPGCGSTRTSWVRAGAQENFLCKTCGACWHPAAGRTDRVDPQHCPGCHLRRICQAACC